MSFIWDRYDEREQSRRYSELVERDEAREALLDRRERFAELDDLAGQLRRRVAEKPAGATTPAGDLQGATAAATELQQPLAHQTNQS